MPEQILPILLIVGGSLLSLYASWQLVKKGLLLWVALLLVGVFLIQNSLQNPMQGLADFDPTNLKNLSLQNIQNLCGHIEALE